MLVLRKTLLILFITEKERCVRAIVTGIVKNIQRAALGDKVFRLEVL